MLFLRFTFGDGPCVIPARDVVEVVPQVRLRTLPHGPPYLAGVFDFRGEVLPVVDLSLLALGRPSRPLYSTRILVVDLGEREKRLLGLLAEGVTDTVERPESGFGGDGAIFELSLELGEIATETGEILQRLRLDRALPENFGDLLATAMSREGLHDPD